MPPFGPDWAFFLDADGTLLELARRPQDVGVHPELRDLLPQLVERSGGAVALVSGRSIAALDAIFTPLFLPAAGLHGLERRDADGTVHRHGDPDALRAVAADLRSFVVAHPGLLLEDKGVAIALHYRTAPELQALAESEMRSVAARLGGGFEVQEGKCVLEVKPAGRHKGSAVVDFMREPPFSGRLPVFIGDDRTDEFGFEAANRSGGHSIKVGLGETCAQWRLDDPVAVRAWLAAWADAFPADTRSGAG